MGHRIFDAHTHIYTAEAYASYMKRMKGNDCIGVVTIQDWTNNGRPKRTVESLIASSVFGLTSVMPAVNVHFDIPKQLHELALISDQIIGVKMYPGYQHFYPSSRLLDVVAEFCVQYEMPLMFHSGAMTSRDGALLQYAHPIHIDELAVRHPECTIIIAHVGFPYLLETAAIVSKNKNVYTDISGTIDSQATKAASNRLMRQYADDLRRILNYYPDVARKMLFGTDYGGEHTHLREVELYIELVEEAVPHQHHDDVFHATALSLFK